MQPRGRSNLQPGASQHEHRREALIRAAYGGELPPEEPLDVAEDAAAGEEAVRLVKESREYRAGFRREE